jgi:hypothetical protein
MVNGSVQAVVERIHPGTATAHNTVDVTSPEIMKN